MAFFEPEVIAGTDIFTSPDATEFHFGILSSGMHTGWVRVVAGRLKSDYRYSAGLVYNNFPWPNPTPEQRARVEEKARAVLAAREPHLPPRGMSTLADLYDPLTMPAALAKAHADLDKSRRKVLPPRTFPLRPRTRRTPLPPLRTTHCTIAPRHAEDTRTPTESGRCRATPLAVAGRQGTASSLTVSEQTAKPEAQNPRNQR